MAIVMLVLLRVAIGWHFLYQGIWKIQNPGFTSEHFLRQAKGPLAGYFHDMIPDYFGHDRLTEETLVESWRDYREQAVAPAAVTEDIKKRTAKILELHIKGLDDFFAENGQDIETYFADLERLDERKTAAVTSGAMFQKERLWDGVKKLEKDSAGWLAAIDAKTLVYQQEITDALKKDLPASLGVVRSKTKLDRIDQLITFSNIAIGSCLMLGLLTRFSAVSGALFLLSIVLAQPELPCIYPPAPASAGRSFLVNKEVIEMLALATLAMLPVGRWGGLDFFVHNIIIRPLFGKGRD